MNEFIPKIKEITNGNPLKLLLHSIAFGTTTKFFGSEIIKNDSNGIVISKPYHENLIKTLENIVKNPKVIERYIENVKKTKVLYDNEEFDKILNIYQKLCK